MDLTTRTTSAASQHTSAAQFRPASMLTKRGLMGSQDVTRRSKKRMLHSTLLIWIRFRPRCVGDITSKLQYNSCSVMHMHAKS